MTCPSEDDLILIFPFDRPDRVLVQSRSNSELSQATARAFVISALKDTDFVLAQLPHVSGGGHPSAGPMGFVIRPLTNIELMGRAGGVDVHSRAMGELWARGW